MSQHCPCGSGSIYESCCEPYIKGNKTPATSEALMRSRYTAYTQANISYIENTMREKAASHFDPASAKQWAESVDWQGLVVITTKANQVTFIAKFIDQDKPQVIFECSEFKKLNGRWFYVDGFTPKVSRNEQCPCSSGKKAKRCCFA